MCVSATSAPPAWPSPSGGFLPGVLRFGTRRDVHDVREAHQEHINELNFVHRTIEISNLQKIEIFKLSWLVGRYMSEEQTVRKLHFFS